MCVCVSVSEASATGPEAVLEACVSTDVDVRIDHSDGGDLSLGNVSIGFDCKYSKIL